MLKKHSLLIGAHISVAGGFEHAFERGESIGCTTLQLFTKSNRQWAAKPITDGDIARFNAARIASPIKIVIAHASYLINIGSSNPLLAQKSITALCDELKRCEQLSIPFLVVHPGSATNSSELECLERIATNLNEVIQATSSTTTILLETMAGQGSTVCYRLEQIAFILNAIKDKKRVGVCFDTCHAFAAGYDFRTPATYDDFWQTFDTIIGLEQLKAIHLNDSKKTLGSRVDRHEDIGKGALGLEPFRLIFNDARFFDIPKILETPKDDLSDDARNIATIMALISDETKELLGLIES